MPCVKGGQADPGQIGEKEFGREGCSGREPVELEDGPGRRIAACILEEVMEDAVRICGIDGEEGLAPVAEFPGKIVEEIDGYGIMALGREEAQARKARAPVGNRGSEGARDDALVGLGYGEKLDVPKVDAAEGGEGFQYMTPVFLVLDNMTCNIHAF